MMMYILVVVYWYTMHHRIRSFNLNNIILNKKL